MAETIIQELFTANGYNVFNYGMERTVPQLLSKIKGLPSEVATSIRCQPDFVVQCGRTGMLYYVEVKFRANGCFSIKDLHEDFPYNNAHFIIVSPIAIKTITYAELAAGTCINADSNHHIEYSTTFNLTPKSIEEFKGYAGQFFGFIS